MRIVRRPRNLCAQKFMPAANVVFNAADVRNPRRCEPLRSGAMTAIHSVDTTDIILDAGQGGSVDATQFVLATDQYRAP